MRLDCFFSTTGRLTRKETADAAKHGRITVNGKPIKKASDHIDEQKDKIALDGCEILYRPFVYFFLNKPAGYVSATEDGAYPCVVELLPPPYDKMGLFPCGRLDKDTLGWLLLTNDGQLSHRLLSPKRHVAKEYRFLCDLPLPADAEERLAAGIALGKEICRPAALQANPDRMGGVITLVEGKYHEIKRMAEALGSHVTYLERISFAGIPLDASLARGACREASEEEIAILQNASR